MQIDLDLLGHSFKIQFFSFLFFSAGTDIYFSIEFAIFSLSLAGKKSNKLMTPGN